MARRAEFVPYRPRTVLNKHKRPDHWFWTRYTAYPYKGCQHGCEFCYCREQKYSPYDDPDDFAYKIKIKENAAQLLRKALSRAPVDAVFTGDYQPAERKFQLSRRMLEVCHELGFPVFILERSPLVLRDLDLIEAIDKKSYAVVAFSAITTPESQGYERVSQIERLSPPVEKRFEALEAFSKAGILTGTCMMPILPGLCDDDENLENVVRWTAQYGGKFVLASGLTLSDQQKDYFQNVLKQRFPDLLPLYQHYYPRESYSASGWRWQEIARKIKSFCKTHGIKDRMPRPIIPGEKRALNKMIAARLADQAYDMEIQGSASHHIWTYRKAAWAIEDLEQDIRLIFQKMGSKGLESIPDISTDLAQQIEGSTLSQS